MIYQIQNKWLRLENAKIFSATGRLHPLVFENNKYADFIYVYSNGKFVDKLYNYEQFLNNILEGRESVKSYVVYSFDYNNQYDFGLTDDADLNEEIRRVFKVLELIKNINPNDDIKLSTFMPIKLNDKTLYLIYDHFYDLKLLYELFFSKKLNNQNNPIYIHSNIVSKIFGVSSMPLYAICMDLFHDIIRKILYKNFNDITSDDDFYRVMSVFLENLIDNFPDDIDRLEQTKQHLALTRLSS